MARDQIEREKRRAKDIAELTPEDYYQFDPILKLNADINLIMGQRSNGKTYSVLKYCLDNYHDKGQLFVYIRRWAEDITVKNMTKLMDPLPVKTIFGSNFKITYSKGAFNLVDETGTEEPAVIGYAVSLNQVAHTKSVPFVNVKTILLDEFLQLKTERILRDEVDAFEQTLSTIIRTAQDVKVFLCGNTVSKYSPYFTHYGIDVNSLKQGEIREIKIPNDNGYTKIAVEWCKYNPKIGKKTSKYVVGSKMAKTGEWEIADVSNIPYTPGEESKEILVFSMFDYVMGINLGVFLRRSKWKTLENNMGIFYTEEHEREFLVIRQTQKISSYYHLTTVKDLKYNTWSNADKMMRDIKENTDIDFLDEIERGRVFAENMFTADYFVKSFCNYRIIGMSDML